MQIDILVMFSIFAVMFSAMFAMITRRAQTVRIFSALSLTLVWGTGLGVWLAENNPWVWLATPLVLLATELLLARYFLPAAWQALRDRRNYP